MKAFQVEGPTKAWSHGMAWDIQEISRNSIYFTSGKSPKSSFRKGNGNNYCRKPQGLLSLSIWNEDKLFGLKLEQSEDIEF